MYQVFDKVIKTDLLSIGGSGAGVTSAIYAAKMGVDVVLVSKGKIGFSGNMIMAGGGFGIDGESGYDILGIEESDRSFTREKMFDCVVKESFFISDQNMVQQYVDEAPIVMKEYLKWAEDANCDFNFIKPCGWMASGREFAKPLVRGIKDTEGIRVFEDVTIVEILTRENKVTGAIGIDIYTGDKILFESNAVVIGTGGYQPFSFKNTVSDMTGDGPAMAYRAGAQLTDMEFLLAFPTAVVPNDMKGSIYPFIFEFFMPNLQFSMRDKNEDIVEIPDEIVKVTRGTKLSKLASSYYMGNAIDQGLGGPNGGLYYDYSNCSQEIKDQSFEDFYKLFKRWHKYGNYKGESISRVQDIINQNELLEVGLGFEYCMGGIVVNEKMETSVNGLFAAGEATSGVFGACRVGDGLTEMLAQGMRAGITAAEYCNLQPHTKIDNNQAAAYINKIMSYFKNEDGINSIQLYNSIEKACDEGFSVIRSEEGLVKALEKILDLKDKLKEISISDKSKSYNIEWMKAMQAENLITCCEAGIRAAIERKESRGCHIRKDYPIVDHDNYLIKYVFHKDGDNMVMETRKPIVTKQELPEGKQNNVLEYFLDDSLNYQR